MGWRVVYARRYGVEELLDCLDRNERAGIVYHRDGIMGDYDYFDDLEELINYIRTGKRKGFQTIFISGKRGRQDNP